MPDQAIANRSIQTAGDNFERDTKAGPECNSISSEFVDHNEAYDP